MATFRHRLDVVDRVYKRDSRGRFGSGGGIRESLANAATTAEVSVVAASELQSALGHPVAVSFKGMDVQLAREHAEGLLQGAERFPNARLGSVSTYGANGDRAIHPGDPDGGAWAVTAHGAYSRNDDDIAFSVSTDPDLYRASLEISERAGYLTIGTPTGTALHEFGHVVTGHDTAPFLAQTEAKTAARTAGRRTDKFVGEQVSLYGSSSSYELAAEAFADVMVRGDQASELSQQIFRRIESTYQRNGANR